MRPHRQQPIRLPHPLDSPGKNTGVVCNFLLQCMKVKSKSEVAQSCLTLSDPMDCSQPGTLLHLKYLIDKSGYIHMYWGVRFWHNYWSEVKWNEVAQSCPTLCDPMDCGLPGSTVHGGFQARILEWVAISFSRRSSRPRDWTRVSHIVGRRFTGFTVWATREVIKQDPLYQKWGSNPRGYKSIGS